MTKGFAYATTGWFRARLLRHDGLVLRRRSHPLHRWRPRQPGRQRAVVPSIWPLEAANATIMGERRKRLDEARSRRFFVLLEALPIVVDDETSSRAFGDIVHLARTYQLSAYDAPYLELAIRRGLPLACNDGKLKTAAQAAGRVV